MSVPGDGTVGDHPTNETKCLSGLWESSTIKAAYELSFHAFTSVTEDSKENKQKGVTKLCNLCGN